MFSVDSCCFDGHGTVQEDRERRSLFAAKHPAKQADQELRAANGKGWNQNFSTASDRLFPQVHKFIHGVLEGSMVSITIGELEENKIGALKRLKVAKYWNTLGSQVARKNDGALFAVLAHQNLNTSDPSMWPASAQVA